MCRTVYLSFVLRKLGIMHRRNSVVPDTPLQTEQAYHGRQQLPLLWKENPVQLEIVVPNYDA